MTEPGMSGGVLRGSEVGNKTVAGEETLLDDYKFADLSDFRRFGGGQV